jgi:hypothetical protein
MNAPALINAIGGLPSMIDRAARGLASATTPAQILEAREDAGLAFDAARRAKRLAKAQQAKANVLAIVHRAEADALEIEAAAKEKFAAEYEAAQARGEVARHGGPGRKNKIPSGNLDPTTTADVGIKPKDVHEGRLIRDAEKAEPGIVRRALDKTLADGDEPSRAAIREAVVAAAKRGLRGAERAKRVNPILEKASPEFEALVLVTGNCRRTVEEAGHMPPAVILSGAVDPGHLQNSLDHIRRCRDFLTRILEIANAE